MRYRRQTSSDIWSLKSICVAPAVVTIILSCTGALGCVGASTPTSTNDDTNSEPIRSTVDIPNDQPPTSEPSTNDGNNTNPNEVASVFRYDVGTRPLIIPDPVVEHRANGFLFHEVYSGLMRPSLTDNTRVEPDLAVSYDISSDGLTYTFKLREDVRFSDGTPLTSQDVKWSWERALRPETNSPRATLIIGVIAGAAEVARGDAQELEGFQIVDDTTFTAALARRNADFLWLLTDHVASVLKESDVIRWPAYLEWDSSDELPVGSGPFRFAVLDNFVGRAVLEPNPYYWDVVPSLDAVEYVGVAFSEQHDFASAWEQRLIDNHYFDGSWCEDVGAEGGHSTDGIPLKVLGSETAPRLSYLAFNTAVAPYDDVDFRRALVASATVEHREFQRQAEPEYRATGLLPPRFPGHDESVQVVPPNRELAESALADSAYAESAGNFNLHMMPELSWPIKDDFERTTANWRDWLGLEVTFTDLPYALWENEHSLQLKKGTLQMRYMNLQPRYPSPHAILGAIPNLFGPNAQSPETVELQRMLDAASAEQDSVRRMALYQDIEDHIIDRAIVLPMFWDEGGSCHGVQDWVEEFSIPKWGGSIFRNAVIDTEHPAYPHRTVGGN